MVQAAPQFRHHQLCCRPDPQLIHVAPSHGPPARILSPLFFQAKSLLLPNPCGKKGVPEGPNFHQSHMVPKDAAWLLCLGLNPSSNLPLQHHFRLLPQSVTHASIPVFFQLYWAAIVSLGRHGPMAWSQSSANFYTDAVPSYILG